MTLWADKTKHVTGSKTIVDSLCYETIDRNRYYLSRIIDVIKFLAVNELPFRGDKEEVGTLNSGMFLKLVEYSFGMDKKFKEISDTLPQNAKYTSPSFQNEMISILASQVHENIVQKIKSTDTGLFTIKCDETRDKCGTELLTVVIRFVNSQCIPEEKLLGMFELTKFDAAFITQQILGAFKDLDLSYLLAQAYDGASVMSGKIGGVQVKMCEAIGRDIPYVHCFNHQLHLVVVHVCEKVAAIQEFFDTSKLLYNFVSKSKVASTYKESGATAMARLMDQRWIGHYKTTKSILDNYDNIVSVLTEFSNGSDAELSVTAIGLLAKIQKERFYFCAQVMISFLGLLKPADKMLQSKSTSLVTGYQLVTTTISELRKLRTEDKFEEIMSKVHEKKSEPRSSKASKENPISFRQFCDN
ncbi:Zinc finger MYM-type protein 1 [Holothuria leucospilota]|uniref:Zinc finger MYM-type protein 1 n=1 Tax=Holothuria leucospilota TaxID=206669 RepID=A0A9Q1HFX5_HOLLE|nr:Zinc finger MYM-type protein 1 [Holothuria leucospilota]